MLMFKGYRGEYEVNPHTGILFGHVLNIRDVITFQGRTEDETSKAFEDSVEDYLDFCQEREETPNQPFL